MAKTGMEKLNDLKREIFKCIHCKACRFAYSGEPSKKGIGEFTGKQGTVLYEGMVDSCPAGIEYGWEAFWNAGKIWIARSILTGDLEFSEEVRDVIYPCITCGQCSSQCENKIPTVDIIEALRAACVEAGIPIIDKHAAMKKMAEERNNPYGGAAADRFKWAKDNNLGQYIDKKGVKVGYYVGCTASYRQQQVAIATCKLFEKLGIDFTIIHEEVCCGSPFFRTGVVDLAQDLMKKNVDAMKDLDTVYFSCAGCYKTITLDYPKWMEGGVLPFKTQHALEIVAEMITEGKLKFKANADLKGKVVTYHDPCHLGRHVGLEIEQDIIKESKNLMMDMRKIGQSQAAWFEKPRTILNKLAEDTGLIFKEMYRIKMHSMCCGAGGGVKAGYGDFSLRTSSLRCDEANAVGADILLTECPFCVTNLSQANEEFEHGMTVNTILGLITDYDLIDK